MNAEASLRPIQIIGVNDIGLDSGNQEISTGRTLPWLQPAVGQEIWTLWNVVYRDVIIVGPGNERLGAFNLTEHDLGDPTNYATLKSLLLDAANE